MEKCLLAALCTKETTPGAVEKSLEELGRLVATAGGQAVGKVVQTRAAPDPATYFGRGKVGELRDLGARAEASTLVVDGKLKPAQEAELRRLTGLKVIDRTAVILDIFAQHARTADGILQVRLAQLQYRLGRLAGRGADLSRLGGGIGTRGPGEQKLEEDRRRIRQQIARLSKRLEKIDRTRSVNRRRRQRSGVPIVALVGYTNAGKSTLLNKLTDTDVLVDDKLFSTLDPHTGRMFSTTSGSQVVLIDTVGFVRELPSELIRAFKATLDEILTADLLIHVVDLASEDAPAQALAVRQILDEIGAADIPEVLALNKVDLLGNDGIRPAAERFLRESKTPMPTPWVAISASNGTGLSELRRAIEAELFRQGRLPGPAAESYLRRKERVALSEAEPAAM